MTTLTTPKRQSFAFPTANSAGMFAVYMAEHGGKDVTITERDGEHTVHWTEHTTD